VAIQWLDSLSVGVEEIDNQHKGLFDAVNKLYDACSQGKGRQEVGKIVDFLGEYVITHFEAEEKLQQQNSYPDYGKHKEEHEKFIVDFTALKNRLEAEGSTLSFVSLVNRTVSDWLIRHISSTDKAFGNFLRKK